MPEAALFKPTNAPRLTALIAEARWQVVHHAPILVLVGLLALAAVVLRETHGIALSGQISLAYLGIWAISLAILLGSLLLGEAVHHVAHVRPRSWRGYWATVRSKAYFTRRRVATAVLPLAMVPTMATFFTVVKWSIPDVVGFRYDAFLMTLDQALHGGHHPWRLLQPVLGHPYVTVVIDRLYSAWYLILYLVLLVQILDLSRPHRRMQYLTSFFVLWIGLGSAMALVFGSAGPVYYAKVVGDASPYADLLAYLEEAGRRVSIGALEFHTYLWAVHENRTAAVGAGISAMPSMHVAIATLNALLAWTYGRRMGTVATLYLVAIQVGSVHLGWHYAVDGYVSMVATAAVWFATGRLLRRHPHLASRRAPSARPADDATPVGARCPAE